MRALDPVKFLDPLVTAKGERRAHVALERLDTLWINTGTLCNLACKLEPEACGNLSTGPNET